MKGQVKDGKMIRSKTYFEDERNFLMYFDPTALTEDLEAGIRMDDDFGVKVEWNPYVEIEQVPANGSYSDRIGDIPSQPEIHQCVVVLIFLPVVWKSREKKIAGQWIQKNLIHVDHPGIVLEIHSRKDLPDFCFQVRFKQMPAAIF